MSQDAGHGDAPEKMTRVPLIEPDSERDRNECCRDHRVPSMVVARLGVKLPTGIAEANCESHAAIEPAGIRRLLLDRLGNHEASGIASITPVRIDRCAGCPWGHNKVASSEESVGDGERQRAVSM